jgi:hypothetical protein
MVPWWAWPLIVVVGIAVGSMALFAAGRHHQQGYSMAGTACCCSAPSVAQIR